jgi:ribose 5-phosphate isomerase B
MKSIAIGSDHAGYAAKERIKSILQSLQWQVLDMGACSEASTDYPDYAVQVSRAVSEGRAERGVLICGTGIGMCMTANKIKGIRAALVTDEMTAEMSRRHNDANVFCAGARVLTEERLAKLLEIWLATPFEGGRHERRVGKINELDSAR